jgi:hypothetical protein
MKVKELEPYLIGHYRELCESIEGGWYNGLGKVRGNEVSYDTVDFTPLGRHC